MSVSNTARTGLPLVLASLMAIMGLGSGVAALRFQDGRHPHHPTRQCQDGRPWVLDATPDHEPRAIQHTNCGRQRSDLLIVTCAAWSTLTTNDPQFADFQHARLNCTPGALAHEEDTTPDASASTPPQQGNPPIAGDKGEHGP